VLEGCVIHSGSDAGCVSKVWAQLECNAAPELVLVVSKACGKVDAVTLPCSEVLNSPQPHPLGQIEPALAELPRVRLRDERVLLNRRWDDLTCFEELPGASDHLLEVLNRAHPIAGDVPGLAFEGFVLVAHAPSSSAAVQACQPASASA